MLGCYGPICSVRGYTPKMRTTWSQLASSEDIYIWKCKSPLIIHNFQNFLGNFSQFILQVFENNLTHSEKEEEERTPWLGCWLGRGKMTHLLSENWHLHRSPESPMSPIFRLFPPSLCQPATFCDLPHADPATVLLYAISVHSKCILLLRKLPHAQKASMTAFTLSDHLNDVETSKPRTHAEQSFLDHAELVAVLSYPGLTWY